MLLHEVQLIYDFIRTCIHLLPLEFEVPNHVRRMDWRLSQVARRSLCQEFGGSTGKEGKGGVLSILQSKYIDYLLSVFSIEKYSSITFSRMNSNDCIVILNSYDKYCVFR